MAMTSLNVYSAQEAPTNFEGLKSAITTGEEPVSIEDLQSNIQFSDKLTIDKKVSISGNKDGSAAFTVDPNPTPAPVPPVAKYDSPAFEVSQKGDLTLENLSVTGFGSTQATNIISNDGKLTIGPGVTFSENKVSGNSGGGRPYPMGSAIITNSGQMTIKTESGGDVTFEKVNDGGNPNPDILFTDVGSLDITGDAGTVKFGNGITSNSGSSLPTKGAAITHSGTNDVVLSGQNDKYTGTYTNEDGSLTFDKDGKTFFGGKSEFTGGELKWENNQDNAIVSGASLTVTGADLTVGNGIDAAKLTTSDRVSIENAKNIEIKTSGELALGKATTFDASKGTTIKGGGKLSVNGQTLSLIGQVINDEASGLAFVSNNATVNIQDVSNGAKELSVIAGTNAANTNLTLNLKNYISGTVEDDITVDGSDIKALNLDGTNTYNGKITISNNGVVTNKTGAETTINDGVSIESTSGTDNSLVNETGATLTIDGANGLENNGNVDNKGTLNLKGSVNTNDGKITNTGSVVVDNGLENKGNFTSTGSGSFSAQNLTNELGTFDMSNSTGEFKVTGTAQNSLGEIKGQSATFGQYNDSTGSGTSLNLTGDLTITSTDENAIQNSGTITAQNINVQSGGVQNEGGTITSNGKMNVAKKLVNSGSISMQGGQLHDIESTSGSITNTGDLTIAGNVTGSAGAITHNSGNLTLTGDGSGFNGTFTQENGSTTVNGGGKLFDGKKEIKNGRLTVNGDTMNWNSAVELGANTTFDFTGTEKSTISDSVLKFTGTDANANFNGSGGYSIADNFNGTGNNLNFTGTTVTLDGTNYANSGNITLNNSKLDLHDEGDAQYKDYTFGNFTAENGSSVDLDLQIVNENKKLNEGYLKSDTLAFNSGSGTLSVGKLYIDNKAQNGVESYTTKNHVIKGEGNVNFDGSSVGSDKITWSSSSFVYDVTASGKDITLSNGRAATKDALNDMNILEGERQFMTENEYEIDKDLEATESGKFNVFGKSKDKTQDSLKGNSHKFFNIGDSKNTELHIDDLTITGASSSQGGSVLRNESSGSKVFINDSYIKDNNSTDSNGGAIYNNGGTGTNPKDPDSFTGLYVGNTTFENNTSTGKGGAIYNDEKGFLYLENVKTVGSSTEEGQNDIYNKGTAYTNGENTFNSLFTNEGEVTFQGTDTLSEFANNASGTANFNGSDATLGTVTGSGGTITHNNGNLTLTGDGSGYTGNFSQTNGNLTVDTDSTFFSGKSTVSGGVLNWFTDKKPTSGTLAVSGSSTVLNVGDATHTGQITFNSGSSIAKGVTTNIYGGSTLNVEGGEAALSDGKWLGNVNLTDGSLTLNNLSNVSNEGTGTLSATGGNLTLDGNTRLTLDGSSSIAKGVVTDITKDAAVSLKQGELTLDGADTWNGTVVLDKNSKGKLTFDGYDTTVKGMGTLQADAGAIDIIDSSKITFGGEEEELGGINKNVKTHIDESSSVTLLENGFLYLNDDDPDTADKWEGKVNLDGGEFYYGVKNPESVGELHATKGDLKLLDQSLLEIKEPSNVDDLVAVDIQQGATVDIQDKAKFNISGHDSETEKKDNWDGLVKNEGGEFTVSDMAHASGNGGGLQQTGGKSTFKDNSDIYISDKNSYITGGDVVIDGNSKLSFGAGIKDMNAENLNMTDNTQLGIMNGEINSAHADNVDVTGTANFTIDLDPRSKVGDEFNFDNIKGSDATLNVSDFNFSGGAPIDRNIRFQLFTGANEGINFDATKDLKFTPIGYYGLQSLGGGEYMAYLDHYNPQVFRGQVATMAMYTSQLFVDDMITNHFILHNDRLIDNAKLANKYAAGGALFAPYQKTYEDGGLWSKSYVSFDKMDLTQGLSVKNNIYGMLMGADLPSVELKKGWEFIPTGYVGYNGGHQHFDGVSMYQNGGQVGAMGTFIKDKFIGSVTAYGGGYTNDMSLNGYEDNAGNWFAGSAVKAAYNYSPLKDFTVQPNLFVAYNAFGKQNWGTDFGIMSMNSGMLNGVNVAPGLNLILQKDTWSLYGTASYMYFANDKLDGYAGNVHLPNVRMDHGYIQYGIGGTKTWNDRLAAYGQVNIRNAGINGIGFQAGINYLFDLNEITQGFIKGSKKTGKAISEGTKSAVNTVSDGTQKTYVKVVKLVKRK